MNITVAIVEDETAIREMLKVLTNGSEGFLCIAAFDNAEDAIREIPQIRPDVVLMDIHLHEHSGIDAVRILKDALPATKFIMCTSLEDTEHIFAALKAGADGYMVKSSPAYKILEAITDAHKGGAPMNSHIAKKVIGAFREDVPKQRNEELEKLTQREKEILEFLSKGLRYKEIGDRMFISTETVRSHISNIYSKLQVNSRTQAINKVFAK